jgi:hypothetical protein
LVPVSSNSFTITVPALSTTAILLKSGLTGITEPEKLQPEIVILPNPVKEMLNISLNSTHEGPLEIVIYDLMGRKIKNSVMNSDGCSLLSVDASELTGGVYLLSVKSNHYTIIKRFSVVK